jgi:hypothetical protein
MSSISGAGSSLYSYLQSLSATQANSPTNPAATANAATAAPATSTITSALAPTASQPAQGAHRHHHHHGGGGGADLDKLQSAVTSALQSAQSSDSSSDPNQVIEDAIARVFQNDNSAAPNSTASPSADSDKSPTTPSSSNASFLQTLQSYGVDPNQFRSDFLSAVQQAQAGQPNSATAFQNFTPGTTVDTIA